MKNISKNFEFKSTINNFGVLEVEYIIIPVHTIKKVIIKESPVGIEFLIKYGFFKRFQFYCIHNPDDILNKILNGGKIESVRACGSDEIEKKFASKRTNFYIGN